MMSYHDIVIIGGGPAGLAAAIEARKNGVRDILLLDRARELGGILPQCIHNGFGLHIFREDLTGPEYAQRFTGELENLGIEYKLDTMVVDLTPGRLVKAVNKTGGIMNIQAGSVILAMGCRERTRGAIGIPGGRPAGVITAGIAQRFVNLEGYMVGKRIIILGSGDIGLIMARRMTLEGARVLAVVEKMPYPGGLARNIYQCLEDYDIPLFLSHTVTRIDGRDRLEAVTVAGVDHNFQPVPGTEKRWECDTLLLSVGLIPENELSRGAGILIHPLTGGPVVNESMETSVAGIFAAGNVVHVHDLADRVTMESRRAGRGAACFIQNRMSVAGGAVNVTPGPGIRYIVPQIIRPGNVDSQVELTMRVTGIYKKCRLVIREGGRVIKKVNRLYLAPAEMETVTFRGDRLSRTGDLLVSVEGVQQNDC